MASTSAELAIEITVSEVDQILTKVFSVPKNLGGPVVWQQARQELIQYFLVKAVNAPQAQLAAEQLADFILEQYLSMLPVWPSRGQQSCTIDITHQGGSYQYHSSRILWSAQGNIVCTDKSVGDRWEAVVCGKPSIRMVEVNESILAQVENEISTMILVYHALVATFRMIIGR